VGRRLGAGAVATTRRCELMTMDDWRILVGMRVHLEHICLLLEGIDGIAKMVVEHDEHNPWGKPRQCT